MASKSKSKNRIAVLDFETDPFLYGRIPEPFTCGVYDGEYYQDFWGDDCADQLAEYIREELQNYTIYAHNGGKFDFYFLMEHLEEDLKIIGGRIAKCKIGEATLTDSYLILPLSLSAYQKDEIDYKIFEYGERDKPKNKKAILAYQKSDCIYLYEWVSKFINRFGKKLTLAGTAFNELKKTEYEPKSTNEYYDDVFRQFYYGGRVQTFKTGEIEGDYTYIDINSAYPYAMLFEHPYDSKYIEKIKIPNDDEWGGYFAHIKAISKGALPFRNPDDNKLYFYMDDISRDYFVTGWEILAGLKTGTLEIIKIHRVYVHERKKNFSEYVNKFYEEKLQSKLNGDKDNELFSKLMLNSCYGKFGQDGRQFKDYQLLPFNCVPEDYKPEGENEWSLYAEHETGFCIWEKPAPVDRFYNVATAASITGFVRAYLWEAICSSENPIYCDTDSLMCEKFHGKLGNELGQWKIEAELDQLYIGGRKFYAVHDKENDEWKTACKGARLSAEQIINTIKHNEPFVWKKDAPSYSLRFGARFLERKISMQKS